MSGNGSMTEVLTRDEKMAVMCPMCEAHAGDVCRIRNTAGNKPLMTLDGREMFHAPRIVKAQQLKMHVVVPRQLTSTDKAVIVYYAFVQLSESCSAKSVEIFGKHYTPQEIQKFFSQTAMAELKRDGLLR